MFISLISEIAEICKLQDRMEECYENRELAPYFELNQEFHSQDFACCAQQDVDCFGQKSRRSASAGALYSEYLDDSLGSGDSRSTLRFSSTLEKARRHELGELMKTHLAHKLDTVRTVLNRPAS